MLRSSFELLKALKSLGFLSEDSHPFWWKGAGEFEAVVGALLTQQSKWERVQESIANLKSHDLLTLEGLSEVDEVLLGSLIKPSGFYKTKAKRLKLLSKNISESFGQFEEFCKGVDREWLLTQKGIGYESADAILCYGCKRAVMVVDAYTDRLLRAFGYEFESYGEIQEWLTRGIEENYDKVTQLYGKEVDYFTIYSRFHGKIVEFVKKNSKKRKVFVEDMEALF
jgi:endonuclease-3 related protein